MQQVKNKSVKQIDRATSPHDRQGKHYAAAIPSKKVGDSKNLLAFCTKMRFSCDVVRCTWTVLTWQKVNNKSVKEIDRATSPND